MPEKLDEQALNLAKAIKRTESGEGADAYQARGASGEFGAFQFMPETYKAYAKKYLGNAAAEPSIENQNKIAYSFVKEKKDAGFSPAQIASMWNAGEKRPNAYREGWVGTNSQGVQYDTPGYVSKVSQAYNELRGGAQTAQAAGPVGTVPILQIDEPVQEAVAAEEEKPKENWLQKLGSILISNEKNFGESIAGAILPATAAGKQFDEAQSQQQKADQLFIDTVIKRRREKEARGEDTSKEDEQLRNIGATDTLKTSEFNPASQKNAKQVLGEAVGVGADILSAGAFGKAAGGLKTGVMGKAVGPTLTAPLTRSQGVIRGLTQGAVTGAGFGAVQGGARAAQEDKDLAGIGTDTLVGGAAGGLVGGALGAGAGAIQGARKLTDPNRVVNKRVEVLQNISERNGPLRRVVEDANKKNIDVKKLLAETDLLVGAVDDTGHVNTQGAIDELNAFLKDGPETVITRNLEREGKRVALKEVEKKLTKAVYDSGLEGGALRRALNSVKDDIEGYTLKADPDGTVPLALIHSAKVDKYANINYLIPESKRADKVIAKALKKMVEDGTESVPVKELNRELSQHYAVLNFLEKLNGKKVQGGKLGKYFAQTVGTIVGSHFGPLGAIVGAELGGDILGRQMASTFGGKIGGAISNSAAMKAAIDLSKMPPIKKLNVQDLPTAFTDELPVIDAGRGGKSKYKKPVQGLPVIR